jgi:hypothetical protein
MTSGSFTDLNFAKRGEPTSFDNMTPADKAIGFEAMAAVSSEVPMFRQMVPVLRDQAKKTLFDEHATKEVLPRLDVVYMYGLRTHWTCIWGLLEVKREIDEEAKQGRKGRSIRFITLPGANHFVSS